jgi:hypothetical protein
LASGASADGSLDCGPGSCRYTARGASVVLMRDSDRFDKADCTADLVVAPVVAWRICPGARIVDRVDSYRQGGYAIWLDSGTLKLESVRDAQGDRLWSPQLTPRGAVAATP